MGAGASIDAVEDLKEVYNSEKEKLTDEQRNALETTFQQAQESNKGEYYVIGACQKEYQNILSGVSQPVSTSAAEPVRILLVC